jgi:hypothetical protein
MPDKIPLDEFAREQICITKTKDLRTLSKRERDRFYVELGRAYNLTKWLQAKGYLRPGAEP